MKRELYDLTDEPFLMFTNRVGQVLGRESIIHNIVGGTAVQSYLFYMLCKIHNSTIQGLISDQSVRVQDYIRSTDDIDVAIRLEEEEDIDKIKRINKVVSELPFEEISPNGQYIVEVRAGRIGASRPTFRVYVDSKGSDQEVIAMNISRGQPGSLKKLDDKWYNPFLDNSQSLEVSYNEEYSLKIKVCRLEHILSTKIAAGRAKDFMDNKNLVDLAKEINYPIDFKIIEKILMPMHTDAYGHFIHSHYRDYHFKKRVRNF